MTLDRESLRCLKFIRNEDASLEEPIRKETIRFLLDRGYIRIASRYRASWGGKRHNVVKLRATPKGEAALEC
jgi:hypothetical protein